MAESSKYGPWVASDDWRSWVGVEVTSETDTAATVRVRGWFEADQGSSTGSGNVKGWVGYSIGNGSVTWDPSGGVAIDPFSAGSSKYFRTKSWTISKTHAAQTVWGYADVEGTAGIYSGYKSQCYASVTVAARRSYAVTYDANGGSGAPSAQTKWHGESLTLSSTKPTRSGWTFVGWATSASATSAAYQPGGSYTSNAALALHALWSKTLTLSYDANGGSGAPASQATTIYNSAASGSLTVSSTRPTRANYNFLGWADSASAASAAYQPGASVSLASNKTLHAVWALAAATPKVTSLRAFRSDSSGNVDGSGTTHVTFEVGWTVDAAATSRSIKYVYKVDDGSAVTVTDTLSATSGPTTKTVAVSIPAASTLSVTVTVTDSTHALSASRTARVPPSAYPVTWANEGMSIGIFGMASAALDRVLQVFGEIRADGLIRSGRTTDAVALTNCSCSNNLCWTNGMMGGFTLRGLKLGSSLSSGSHVSLGTLPAGYRPAGEYRYPVVCATSTSFSGRCFLAVSTAGALTLYNEGSSALGTSVNLYVSDTYPV